MVAPNGWLGKTILEVFVEAAKKGDFAKLKIITSKESDVVKQAVKAAPENIEVAVLEYQDKPALGVALKGVDVVISTMGGQGAQAANEQALIEASEYNFLSQSMRRHGQPDLHQQSQPLALSKCTSTVTSARTTT